MKQSFLGGVARRCVSVVSVACVLCLASCEFWNALEAHDPSIVPQAEISLERSTVAAIRALPSLLCGLDAHDPQAAGFAIHVALPNAEAGQPMYVVNEKMIDCAGNSRTIVTRIRAKPDGPAWRDAQLTVRAFEDRNAAATWLDLDAVRWNDPVDASTQQFIWHGDVWIAR